MTAAVIDDAMIERACRAWLRALPDFDGWDEPPDDGDRPKSHDDAIWRDYENQRWPDLMPYMRCALKAALEDTKPWS